MHVRNARNCALITTENDVSEDEAANQYRIENKFLDGV